MSERDFDVRQSIEARKFDWLRNLIIFVVIVGIIVLIVIYVFGTKRGLGWIEYFKYFDITALVIGLVVGLPTAYFIASKLGWGINSFNVVIMQGSIVVEESTRRIISPFYMFDLFFLLSCL